ncbi:ribosome recycling factor [Annulohypoxylon bovei var. microspora]|nr:ribosome recycling factor [Annulohypoxylon bovei var. microspora]
MRNTAARTLLRQSIARPELSRAQDVVLRPRLAATGQKLFPRQCLRQLSAPSPSLLLGPRAFHTSAQHCKAKPREVSKGKQNRPAPPPPPPPSDGGGGSRHPAANGESPLDFADVESRVQWQSEHFTAVMKKLRSGGRFNPDVVGALRVQPDRKESATYPLKELAAIVPQGGRAISILAHEEAYVKPIMSAVQASADFNQQPQRVPDNDLELLLKIEPESKDDLLKRAKATFTEWRDRLRSIRHKRDKTHTTWLRGNVIGPDLKRTADKELDKLIKAKMTEIDSAEKDILKAVKSE